MPPPPVLAAKASARECLGRWASGKFQRSQFQSRYKQSLQPRMIDCFAFLCEPRRPWLDTEALKDKFLALSAEVHPDRMHSASDTDKQAAHQRYIELNSAYNRLRDPKERLLHLLELELGSKPNQVQAIPSELMEMFAQLSQAFRNTDAFLAEKSQIKSPLLQVHLFERSQEVSEKLTALQQEINSGRDKLDAGLKALDEAWISGSASGQSRDPMLLRKVEELYRLYGYFGRWGGQNQERIVQLSF